MCSRWFVLCVVGLCCVRPAAADTIVLRNGEHIEGQIVGETAGDVSISRKFRSGNIRFVEKINRTDIVRIERSATQPAAEGVAPAPARPAAAEEEVPTAKIPDKPAFLAEAIRKYEKPDYRAAGMDLSRLIISSTAGELQRLSSTVDTRLHMSLAELAATAHFRAALERARGRSVQLQYVTEYEKPALILMLEEAYEKAVETAIDMPDAQGGAEEEERDDRDGARSRGRGRTGLNARAGAGRNPNAGQGNREDEDDGTAGGRDDRAEDNGNAAGRGSRRTRGARRSARSSQQAGQRGGRDREEGTGDQGAEDDDAKKPTSRPAMTIRQWLDKPEEFDGSRREAFAMEVQIQYARSLLGERVRLDPRLRTDAALKSDLAAERSRLNALLKAVKARAGGALTAREREAIEAEMNNRFDAARREEWRRRNAALLDLQRIIEEQERNRQPVPGAGPPPRN